MRADAPVRRKVRRVPYPQELHIPGPDRAADQGHGARTLRSPRRGYDRPPREDDRYFGEQTAHQKAHETVGKGVMPVDAHFHVKGVGVVVLGSVAQGSIKKHETVKVLPTSKTAQIRSIQKHDADDEFVLAGPAQRRHGALYRALDAVPLNPA